jgi:hypothetical protein
VSVGDSNAHGTEKQYALDQKPRDWAAGLRRLSATALWALRGISAAAWAIVRGPLVFVLQLLAALILIFEEWGWKPLSEALVWLAKFAPVAALERWIAGLPPYGALAVFAVPITVLFPLKLAALWLITFGFYGWATALFIFAKIASTALIARIFTLTKPALLQVTWFASAYTWFVPWKDAFFKTIRDSWVWRYGRMLKNRIKLEVHQTWVRWRGASRKE